MNLYGGMLQIIIDTLANMELYKNFNEKIYKGLTFLKKNDLIAMPVGRYVINGDAILALVQEYATKPLESPLHLYGYSVCRASWRNDGIQKHCGHNED